MLRIFLSVTQLLAGAALALLVASTFSPSRATASCGDYVTVGGKHAPMAGHIQPGANESSAPAVPCPCRGPECSQQPQAPVVPPAPPPTVTPTDWACFFAR